MTATNGFRFLPPQQVESGRYKVRRCFYVLGGSVYSLAQNLRFAFRQLRKAPGFTVSVVLIMALGIGATTAIFSLVEGILLRPLPFSVPDRLVLIGDRLGGNSATSVT